MRTSPWLVVPIVTCGVPSKSCGLHVYGEITATLAQLSNVLRNQGQHNVYNNRLNTPAGW